MKTDNYFRFVRENLNGALVDSGLYLTSSKGQISVGGSLNSGQDSDQELGPAPDLYSADDTSNVNISDSPAEPIEITLADAIANIQQDES